MNGEVTGEFGLLSIIIPMRNEERFVAACLDSVITQLDDVGPCEILCIDGQSTDRTRDIVADYARVEPRIRLLTNPGRVVPKAMNIGLRAARGDVLIRLDCHARYPSDYLMRCLETLARTGAENVGSVVVSDLEDGTLQAALVRALTTHRFGVGGASFRLSATEGPADTVPYGCYRRSVFDQIGFYDERLVRNQDYELNRRLVKAGGRIWLNPAIRAYYYNRDTLAGLFHQAFVTGKWNAWMWHVAPYALALRHAVPAVFVISLLLSALLTVATSWGYWLLILALFPYFAGATVASVQQSLRYHSWLLLTLPILFLAYHLCYGAGTLWGVLLLILGRSPVQRVREPWPGAGRYRAWPGEASGLR